MVKTRDLDKLFDPVRVAVVGASNSRGSVGNILIRNLLMAEHRGVIYPIHRSAQSVHGIQAYPSIDQVPRKVDLAVIAVPATSVPRVVDECGMAGVGAVIVVSSGFKEAGPEGSKLEKEMLAAARSHGIRVLGPNCLGIIRPGSHLNATFAPVMPESGRVCFISQSGALGTAILDWAVANHVGFSAFVSVGSMCDVDFGDLIDYFGADARTNSIILYIESLPDARKFMRAARHFSKTKPIVIVKSGSTATAALAAAQHHGVDAGDDRLYSAAFRRAGAVRVPDVESLFGASEALCRVPRPHGPRLGIVTNAGGPAIMAADRLHQLGGELATLCGETQAALRSCLPSFAARTNPVDVGDDATPARFVAAVRATLNDPHCDGVLAILAPHIAGDPAETAEALVEAAADFPSKPLLTSFMGGGLVNEGLQRLHKAHVPAFHTPEDAVSAYAYLHEYTKSLATLYQTPDDILPQFTPDRKRVKAIFAAAAREGRRTLTEIEAKEVLAAYEIPVIATQTATSAEQCGAAARKAGFPVAVKIHSPDVTDKAAVGGIAFDVRSVNEAGRQYATLTAKVAEAAPEARQLGVTIHPMSRRGLDVVVGSWRDATFGPALYLQAREATTRQTHAMAVEFPPVNQTLAESLIAEADIASLPQRNHDTTPVDLAALEQALVKFSYLLVDFPEIVQTELNPLQLRSSGIEVLDARIVIEPKDVRRITRPGSHLILSMYPSSYRQIFTLDGEEIEIRAIKPEDEQLWSEMIASLSRETAEYRFFGPVREITKAMLVRYCHIDYDSEIALIAMGREPRMLGVASLTVDRPGGDEAEFAIVVRDDCQNKGIGTRLMNALIEAARDKYIREIVGHVLAANGPMLRFCESLGFEVLPSDEPDVRQVVLRT
jgi:acetyltransferase